jgi:hypothetical protein
VDKVRTNVLQWGRRVIVELHRLSAERPRYTIRPPGFFSNCLSRNAGSWRIRLTSPVVPKIRRPGLHRHLEKKELEVTKGVEDHVKFVAVALNTALEAIRRKGESALLKRRRGSSAMRHNVDLRS